MTKGRCECGQVAYTLEGPLTPVTYCHCSQCRRLSGHHWAATSVPSDKLHFTNDAGLKWFASSDWARRGFCGDCGAMLFYEMKDEGRTSVAAGSLDAPTGLVPGKHIFVADKGDYYDITDGVKQIDTY